MGYFWTESRPGNITESGKILWYHRLAETTCCGCRFRLEPFRRTRLICRFSFPLYLTTPISVILPFSRTTPFKKLTHILMSLTHFQKCTAGLIRFFKFHGASLPIRCAQVCDHTLYVILYTTCSVPTRFSCVGVRAEIEKKKNNKNKNNNYYYCYHDAAGEQVKIIA